jgi:hypothetical protein
MMKNFHLLTILFGLLLTSCATKRLVSTTNPVHSTQSLAYFTPYAYISIIEKGNTAVPNDSLSEVARLLLDSIILENKTFKQKTRVEISDVDMNYIQADVNNLFNSIIRAGKIEQAFIGPNLKKYIDKDKNRYYLTSIMSGFGRKQGNYGKQVAKGIGVGILTLGMFAPIPIKSNVSLYAAIIDAEKMEVVYYSSTLPLEKSPTDRHVIERQYFKVLSEHFIKK